MDSVALSDQSDLFVFNIGQDNKIMDITDLYNQTEDWILSVCEQDNSVPVDLDKILDTFNISAVPMDFSNIENNLTGNLANAEILGALITSDNNTTIFYSDKHEKDSHRNRFTIAHEIAHCCIQGQGPHVEFGIKGIKLDETEMLANIFAGALLIPEKNLNKIIDQLILPSLHTLADIFEVSENVMKARLSYLKIKKNIIGYNL